MSIAVAILVSVLPILLFLGALVLIDSYKLVALRAVLLAVLAGVVAGAAGFGVNVWLRARLGLDPSHYSRYVAPVIEETLKGAYVVYLMSRNRVGFVVDAAILGFAVGSGFAVLENIYYLQDSDATIWTWVVRGFGTAVMHGGTTAIFAMLARTLHKRSDALEFHALLAGLGVAVVLHSLYNHFLLQPLLATAAIMLTFPYLAIAIFQRSERDTRSWLGSGFDMDQELLRTVRNGQMSETPVGQYLTTLRSRFAPEVIVDMLCLLRLRAELGIRAKGLLMMREAGFDAPAAPDSAIHDTFVELRYLERNIGKTGMLALHPFIHTRTQDLWQLNLLDEMQK
ncbi:MAG TPA: PrsW family glutamic-type intramembrane protease [Gemmatimonadaceae bacterium]|nr:PrsW family glutamic-type intramembrane protease [Gemmatimonadaceae bacterium]